MKLEIYEDYYNFFFLREPYEGFPYTKHLKEVPEELYKRYLNVVDELESVFSEIEKILKNAKETSKNT